MEEEEHEITLGKELSPALVALHPHSLFVIVAVGAGLRVFNLSENVPAVLTDNNQPSCHVDAIKTIRFSQDGLLFVSAGDDKLVKLWDTRTWSCLKTVPANKKVSAATFSICGQWLLFADKFGVVYAVSTTSSKELANDVLDQPVQLLAHCCSIITGLECSPNGRYLVTSDRDFKIRVSMFPRNPLMGTHDIQSFCLGHTNFVSCVAFIGEQAPFELIVSGGGDATVRLWDPDDGKLLDTVQARKMAGLRSLLEEEEVDLKSAITGISTSHDGSLVAVTLGSLDGALFLRCDFQSKKLSFLQKVVLSEHFSPTSISFDGCGRLWLVAGAGQKLEVESQPIGANAEAKAQAIAAAASTRIRVVRVQQLGLATAALQFDAIEDECIPGGELLLQTLEGNRVHSTKAVAAAADAANDASKNHLLKREYTQEHREHRKLMRNDKKLKNKY